MPPILRLANTLWTRFAAVEEWQLNGTFSQSDATTAKKDCEAKISCKLVVPEIPPNLSWMTWVGKPTGSGTVNREKQAVDSSEIARGGIVSLEMYEKFTELSWPDIICHVTPTPDPDDPQPVRKYDVNFGQLHTKAVALPPSGDFIIQGKYSEDNQTWKKTWEWTLTPKFRVYEDYELRLRLFIPAPFINLTDPVGQDHAGSGDNRDFSYSATSYRAHQQVNISLDPSIDLRSVIPERDFGYSKTYFSTNPDVLRFTRPVGGKPWWWVELIPGSNTRIDQKKLLPDPSNSRVEVHTWDWMEGIPPELEESYASMSWAQMNYVSVFFGGHATAPTTDTVEPVAPAIDWEIYVKLKIDILTKKPEMRISATHDGFPAYELYLNGKLIYSYDPVLAGASPLNLFPPMDVKPRDEKWVAIP